MPNSVAGIDNFAPYFIILVLVAIVVILVIRNRSGKSQGEDEADARKRLENIKAQYELIAKKCDEVEKAHAQKIEAMDRQYKEIEAGHKKHMAELQVKSGNEQVKLQGELAKDLADRKSGLDREADKYAQDAQARIDAIRKSLEYYESLEAAVVAENVAKQKKELERDFYRIHIDDIALSDIAKLKPVAMQLSKPVILYKLIYEIYYKTQLEELFKRLAAESDPEGKGGIYKITNINDNRIYIGRTTNFITRWRMHARCGTGADPKGAQATTRLYEAMRRDGCENFTFEIIDVCSNEDHAEREKYWIGYYKSAEYGYNIQSGGG